MKKETDYFFFKLKQKEVEVDELKQSIEIINQAQYNKEKVLVHCATGKRAATFAIYYLMKGKHFTLKDAYDFVINKEALKPFKHYLQQLIDLESYLDPNDPPSLRLQDIYPDLEFVQQQQAPQAPSIILPQVKPSDLKSKIQTKEMPKQLEPNFESVSQGMGSCSLCNQQFNNSDLQKTFEAHIEQNHFNEFQKCQICLKYILNEEIFYHKSVHMNLICESLYLGGQRNASNRYELTFKNQIDCILNVAGGEVPDYFKGKFDYMTILLEDQQHEKLFEFQINEQGEKIIIHDQFSQPIQFIRENILQNRRVFVHCIQGISRSSSVIIAYLIKEKNMSLKTAYDLAKSQRNVVRPNKSFLNQLIDFERYVRGETSMIVEDIYVDPKQLW